MEIVILPDRAAVASLAADVVERLVRQSAHPVLGLATGSSPLATYAELRRRHTQEGLSFASTTAFLLDEYVGLPVGHPESYREVIRRELTDHLDIPDGSVHAPDGATSDIPGECARYERLIAYHKGIDVQFLGIGGDGHLGFNEPGSSLVSRTRIKTLTSRTRADNARFFGSADLVPRHVLTQGLGTICDARHLLLLATGPSKAEAIAAAVEGPVSAVCPASVLQLHPHVSVLLDSEAASHLAKADFYREVYDGKPAWQVV